MTEEEKRAYLKDYEAKLITPAERRSLGARGLERGLPLSRLREDLRTDGQGLCGSIAEALASVHIPS